MKVYLLLCCLSESDVDFQFGNIYDNGGMKHLNKIQHKQEHIGWMSVLLLVAKMMASLVYRRQEVDCKHEPDWPCCPGEAA